MKSRSIGISLQFVNVILNMLCGLFLSAFLLRTLGDTEYGIYQTISSFVNYLVLFEFGTGTVITRNISQCRARGDNAGIQKNISTIWCINCVLIGIVMVVGIVLYGFLDEIYSKTLTIEQILYGKQIFLVMLAFLVASFLSNTLNGILIGYEKFEIQPIIAIIKLIIRTLALIILVLFIRKSIVIAWVDLLLVAIVDVGIFVYCQKMFGVSFRARDFDRSIFKSNLPLAIAIFIQVLVNQANNNVDKFVIGIEIGPEEVTVYSVGLYIFSVFSSLTTIPVTMYAPQVVKEITTGLKPNEVSDHLVQPSRLVVIIGGTVLFGFFAVGRQFISLVYGDSYVLAWQIALIIMAPMLINMSNGIMINILDATNKRMARSGILLLTTIANIILTFVWIKSYGIIGASIATAVCTLLGQILLLDLYYYIKLGINVISFKMATYKGILIFQLFAGVSAYFIGILFDDLVVSLLMGGIVFLTVFAIPFYFLGASKFEIDLIKSVSNKLLHKKT